jgi:hypothetical protein
MARGWRRYGPVLCAQWYAFASEQEARILHDTLQLREHLTGDEILANARDGIGLEAMLLRRGRMSGQHRSSGNSCLEDHCVFCER